MNTRSFFLCAALGLTVSAMSASAQAAPPPMPNPSAMSGIPRPDPKLPSGTVTVRCLGKAGFSAPAVDLEVELVATSKDGQTKRFTAKTQEQGRATFDGLADFVGGTAVAKATVFGSEVSSSSIRLLPGTGTAVMLVEGASTPAGTRAPAARARPATPNIPPPGNAFPLEGTEVGTLTIGTFDLDARRPIGEIEVKLTITPPDGDPVVRTLTTDARGKAIFDKLSPPDTAAGSTFVAEATLVVSGELRKSASFTMSEASGMALVLAEGAENFEAPSDAAPPPAAAPVAPQALPGPRILRTMSPGTVRVKLWNGTDGALAEQNVLVVKKTAAGAVDKYRGTTGADGSVLIEDVPVQQDALYFVESIYSGAPYQSSFFGMDKRGGVAVDMRLWETTTDRSVVRSAVQYDIDERENDLAQIVQVYEVMVDGDKAFWDPKLEITSTEGSKGFVVLRPAEAFLDHEEKAPFATLHGPIPPGQLTNLSIGYLLEHSGTVQMEWTPPFALIQGSVLVGETLELAAQGSEASELPSPIPDKVVHTLPAAEQGTTIAFAMSGLRHRDPTIKKIGWWGLGAFGLVTFGGLLMRRPSRRGQLEAQRDRLLRDLESMDEGPARNAAVSELDRVVRQLEVVTAVESADRSASAKG